MNTKTKKIVNIIVNVVVVIILAFVLIITLSMIFSRGKGYTEMFGKTRIAVISDSMDGPKPEGVDSSKPAGFKVLGIRAQDNDGGSRSGWKRSSWKQKAWKRGIKK